MADNDKNPPKTMPADFETLKDAGEFWDEYSTADYEFEAVAVDIDLPPRPGQRIRLAADLADKLTAVAKQQGISAETLANLWLQEKLSTLAG
ncbi:MAG: hypothetical protein KDD89_04795 [Anaerolineales bacterium]|nr:hypothetical protein [Anaerolineales bacterium]